MAGFGSVVCLYVGARAEVLRAALRLGHGSVLVTACCMRLVGGIALHLWPTSIFGARAQ